MYKLTKILAAIMVLTAIGTSIEYVSTLSITGYPDNQESIYTDLIMQVYNNTCIETANYQYVFINNSNDMLDGYGNITIGNWIGVDIMVKPVKEIGSKSLLADVWV